MIGETDKGLDKGWTKAFDNGIGSTQKGKNG